MIVPAGHRLLVKADEVSEKTSGGLYLAVETKERQQNQQVMGTIVAIGPNCWKAFDDGIAWAQVGDKVFYARNGGWLVKDPDTGKPYIILADEDVCAIVREGSYE